MIGQITKLADTKMRDVRRIELSDCNYDNVCGDGLQTTPVFKQHFSPVKYYQLLSILWWLDSGYKCLQSPTLTHEFTALSSHMTLS